MAKIYGLFGAMTGKVADVVMVVRNGVQVARKYQPIVSNPSSAAQVAVRAKLKLLSQFAAVVGPYIAIPREGIVSARNLFMSANYPLVSYSDNQADIVLTSVQLTKSVLSLPPLFAERQESSITASLAQPAPGLTRVVYVVFAKQQDGTLRFVNSQVSIVPGNLNTFPIAMDPVALPLVVYAYGLRDNTETAKATFGNLTVLSAETVAKLLVTRMLSEADVSLTETRGVEVPLGN